MSCSTGQGHPWQISHFSNWRRNCTPAFGLLLGLWLGIDPAIARSDSGVMLTGLSPTAVGEQLDGAELWIAQVREESVLYFETPSYTAHVYRDGAQYRMNIVDNVTQQLLVNRAIAANSVTPDFTLFQATGIRNGTTVTYRVLVDTADQISLQMFDGAGNLLNQEFAEGDQLVRLASAQRPETVNPRTVLAFSTATYATRLFQRPGNEAYVMNVYNRQTTDSLQNGIRATLAPATPPNDRQVSYVSEGTFNGQPARFFMRIDGTGQTVLEIVDANGMVLVQEPGVGPVTLDIPREHFPDGMNALEQVNNAYIAAVFGDLEAVQQLYPDATEEASALGAFINAGSFANRDLAMARVLELRARGFNTRLIYRNVQYR